MNNSNEKPTPDGPSLKRRMPSAENQLRKLTPEQQAELEDNWTETSKAITDGLHKDNREIFGADYLDKKN